MRYIFLFLFICSTAYAQVGEVIEVDKNGEIILIEKPDIPSDKVLDEFESKQVKDVLWNEDVKLIFKELYPAKNDYVDRFDRGTVYYTEKNRNYCFSRVIIPDGTTVKNCNFTQKNMNTEAISGKNLTFIDCNLVNNVLDPKWTIIGCNTAQVVLDEE